jgi:catechol 2,3-dioxygenase-like lactoylglutathione lyase family enzyme
MTSIDLDAINAERERIKQDLLADESVRPESSARGLHHIAISVTREKWDHLRGKLDAAGIEYAVESGSSVYFRDPDGARLELLADPLGEMYGTKVL